MAASPASEGISLQVTIHISPEDVPKFFEAFTPVYEKVINEPECTHFEVFQDLESPGTLSWVENWTQSKEWLVTQQMTKDYFVDYLAVTTPMFIKPREVKLVSRVGGSFAMSKKSNGRFLD